MSNNMDLIILIFITIAISIPLILSTKSLIHDIICNNIQHESIDKNSDNTTNVENSLYEEIINEIESGEYRSWNHIPSEYFVTNVRDIYYKRIEFFYISYYVMYIPDTNRCYIRQYLSNDIYEIELEEEDYDNGNN